MARYVKTKYTGVFSQPSATRMHNGRPDLAWYIVYQLDGKRKWEKIGWLSEGYSAAMANAIRAERVRDNRGHTDILPQDTPTFGRAWEIAWDRHIKNLKWAENDKNRYEVHLAASLANLPLDRITAADIDKIKDDLLDKNRAPATIKHVVGLIGRIYNLMIKWGLWQGSNPLHLITLPKTDNRRSRYLTKNEAARLLAELKKRSEYTWQMAIISIYTGMRAGEIMALKGENIDLESARAYVRDTKNKTNRTVYLPAPVLEMLSALELKPGRPALPRPKGGSYERVNQSFSRAVKALGLNDGLTDRRDRVVFHTLRHTFASWLVIQGKDLYLVGTLLGHSSTDMTRRYAHLAPETQRAAVEAIEGYFNNADQSS